MSDLEIVNRPPPHNIEAEQSLLGAMMIREDAIARASELVKAEDFYLSSHRILFSAMIALYQAQKPVDPVIMIEQLRSQNQLSQVGGATYLAQITNAVPVAGNAEHYARIVKDKSVLRALIRLSHELAGAASEPQVVVDELLDRAENRIFDLNKTRITAPYVAIGELLPETLRQIEQLYEHKDRITGVPSGFKAVDDYTSGFQRSDLIIVAARPSMGKTAFCLNIAQHVAIEAKTGVLLFSLEMSKQQLVQRIICAEAHIDGQKVRRGFLNDEDWTKIMMTVGTLDKAPIFIDDTASIPVLEMRAKARRAKAQNNIGLIIVDYLQLMTIPSSGGGQMNREQEISTISRALKGLARELNVPVIALSQLSRQCESRSDKRPMLSDLRESGAIEQDADVVFFLFREEYYNPAKEDCRGRAEVIIAKQRNGPTGSCLLQFSSAFARFHDLDLTHQPPH